MEFGKFMQLLVLFDLLSEMDILIKFMVVVLYGMVLGGGLEVVLICYYWVVLDFVKVGLFEVLLGILFGVGGI